MDTVGKAGWCIGESVALELNMLLQLLSHTQPQQVLTGALAELLAAVPADWLADWNDMFGEHSASLSILDTVAGIAGVLYESDYGRASLAMRQLSVDTALARVAEQAGDAITPDIGLEPSARLANVLERWQVELFTRLGFALDNANRLRRFAEDAAEAVRILVGGDRHERFWHWLDRLYYQVYQPWRASQQPLVESMRQRAALFLGAPERSGAVPDLSWLPPQNPVLRLPELHTAVTSGAVEVYFWAEPFGMADTWGLEPGRLLVSFAEPGELYENFYNLAADVSARAAALADPTRLIILRIIRHFGMVNTEIAAYLQLARPTVSVHAKILREAGLIRSRQDGRLVRHEIVPGAVNQLFKDLREFLDLPEED